MSSIKPTKYGTFELKVSSKLLPKTFYRNFKLREDAQAFGDQLEALIKQGIVPVSLLEDTGVDRAGWPLLRCVSEYLGSTPVASSDRKLLDTVRPYLALYASGHVNYGWVEDWIKRMKREQNLAPSTIRHRIGAVSRCFDYIQKKNPDVLAMNPILMLRRGYSQYNSEDQKAVEAKGNKVKIDEERDRRLDQMEEAQVTKILAGNQEHHVFFTIAIETAMRMREIYTLTADQINLDKATIFLNKTKNGDARQVPLSSVAKASLRQYMKENAEVILGRKRRLFHWWKGDTSKDDLDRVTTYVSKVFSDAFGQAKLEDFHFHDLRHEATCRLFLRTSFSDIEIARITGHKDLRMLKRYASLRGSELAERMW
jgi:integrase